MNLFKMLGDFILSAWIWQFTADWFHPVITGIVMFFIMRWVMRRPRMQAILISICAQLFALGLLSLIAVGILVQIFNWEFAAITPEEGITRIGAFMPSIGLGIIYAILQSLFFRLGSYFWPQNVRGLVVLSWISNGIGAILSYMCIRFVEIMTY